MKRLPFYALVCFFILLYTQGLWTRFGIPKLVLQGLLLALPLSVLLSQRKALGTPAPGFLFLWFYLGWSLSACIYHDEGVLRGLLYPRFLISSYLVFWATWNSRFTRRQLFGINAVILALFFVQVLAALFYWLVLGQKFEYVVGTMAFGTGAIATTFPMFAFSFLLAFFLYYNRLLFLVGAFSFFAVSHASGKLGVYYLIPLMLVLGMVLYASAEGVPKAIRRSRAIVLISLCTLPLLVFLISHTERKDTMSMRSESGLYNQLTAFFRDNFRAQTDLERPSWYTTTRMGTSQRVLQDTLRGGPLVFLFGRGPRICLSEGGVGEAASRYGIVYGIVGWSADALAVGWPAMFAHLGFYTYLFELLRRDKSRGARDPYWKAIRLTAQLGFCVFLFSYFLYSNNFTTGGWLSSVHLYLLAVLLASEHPQALPIHPKVSRRPTARATSCVDRCNAAYKPSLPRPTLL